MSAMWKKVSAFSLAVMGRVLPVATDNQRPQPDDQKTKKVPVANGRFQVISSGEFES